MTEQRKDFPEFYLTRPQPCPYLPDRDERKLFTHLGSDKSVSHFDFLHRDGFRRSQTIAYRPHCENCSACVSVRIAVDDFKLSKSQKRIWKANRDMCALRMDAHSSGEQYALFKAYVETRHNEGGMADMSLFDYQAMIEDSLVDSFIAEYRHTPGKMVPENMSLEEMAPKELGRSFSYELSGASYKSNSGSDLIALALCDQLSDGVSLVYSFFDTHIKHRSIGSFIILETIEYARSLSLPYVYLGYWVKGSQKMDYKIRFLPQDHLIDGEWVRVNSNDDIR